VDIGAIRFIHRIVAERDGARRAAMSAERDGIRSLSDRSRSSKETDAASSGGAGRRLGLPERAVGLDLPRSAGTRSPD
jgi:hypothetical protein